MDNIEFRKAEEQDLNAVFLVFTDAIDEMIRHNILQWDELYPDRNILYNDIQSRQLYIGMIEDKIASVFVLNQECDEEYTDGNWEYPNATYYVIHRLCVNPHFQNRGIGLTTMKHIHKEMKQIGIETIRLDSYTLNPYAVKMYTKLGYNKVGYVNWRKGRFYLMEKKL
ncbi:MAG: GNAT family N-acetyltransferase [Lachnotalea sp.]